MSSPRGRQGLAGLTLGALGVVYGDIGTSPLYTMKEIFGPATGVPLDAPNVLGVLSLVFWALIVVVTLKYVLVIMRADNHGEGGIMALTALASARRAERPARRWIAASLLGVFGAALFYGDGVITPAISVLVARSRASRSRRRRCSPGRAAHAGDPGRAVRDPAPRHRPRRRAVRPGDGRLVRGARRARHAGSIARAARRCCGRSTRRMRLRLLREPRRGIAFVALGAVVLVRHRRRGAVRRHGPFRPAADPARLVRPRAARARCSTTSARARCCSSDPDGGRQPVLPAGAAWALHPAGGAGDGRHGDRVAGGDLGRVLDDAAGDPARLPAAHGRSATPRSATIGPDLHPGDQLDAVRRRRRRSCSASSSSEHWRRRTASRSPARC